MSHQPFIWAAYGFAILALAWCALAPVLKARKMARLIRASHELEDRKNAPGA